MKSQCTDYTKPHKCEECSTSIPLGMKWCDQCWWLLFEASNSEVLDFIAECNDLALEYDEH